MQIFNKLKENTNKMLEVLKSSSYDGEGLLNTLNERNKLFETIYNTKFNVDDKSMIEDLITQNKQIMELIENKRADLRKNFWEFKKSAKSIMKYLK